MDPQQTRKRPRNTIEFCDRNARQHEIYHNMSTPKKNALLLQRRINKREATTKRLLQNANSSNSTEAICINQDNPTVGCSSSIFKTAAECGALTTSNLVGREKSVAHPFYASEKGSASGATNDSGIEIAQAVKTNATKPGALTPSNLVDREKSASHPFYAFEKGSISGTTNDSPIEIAKAVTTNGLARGKKFPANISQLQSNYVHLQRILHCIYCGAKKFEYEAPGFCCGKGKSKTFIATDEAVEFNNQAQFEDLLHTLHPPGFGC